MRIAFALPLMITVGSARASSVFAGQGYTASAYGYLSHLTADVCVGHSVAGVEALLQDWRSCSRLVIMGHAPVDLSSISVPTLVLAGTRDGVSPFARFAVLRHLSQRHGHLRFAAVPGASHHSFASGDPSALSLSRDLVPAISTEQAHQTIAAIVQDFLGRGTSSGTGKGLALQDAEQVAAALAGPVVAALKLEGSAALGQSICESDYPTNPTW